MAATTPPISPWTLGDFHVIGAPNAIAGDILCEDCVLGAGHRVLDVACGSGNTALAAAKRGNAVTGLDLHEKLIERARVRANAEGFNIEFMTGNAEALPFEDSTFDYVLSTFGVMFAPNQERAANELLRVCKPGGTIGLSNWTVESFPGAMFGLSAKYAPPPQEMRAPIEWGTIPGLQRLFGNRIVDTRIYDRCFRSNFVDADQWLSTFKQHFGPTIMLYERVPKEQHSALDEEVRQSVLRYNRAMDGTLGVAMSYINVILTKR